MILEGIRGLTPAAFGPEDYCISLRIEHLVMCGVRSATFIFYYIYHDIYIYDFNIYLMTHNFNGIRHTPGFPICMPVGGMSLIPYDLRLG